MADISVIDLGSLLDSILINKGLNITDSGIATESVDVVDVSAQRRIYRFSAMAERGIFDWVTHAISCNEATDWGGQVIWDKPGEDRPDKPYVVLNFLGGPVTIGCPDREYYSLDTWVYTYRKSITLSVSVCANNAYIYYMKKILNSFHKECCYRYLRQSGLSYWMHYGFWDMSGLVDAEFEFMASANIVLSFGYIEYVKDGEIHKVKVNNWLNIEIP